MTIRDSWTETINDGDQLDDGYFNAQTKNTRQELGEVRMFALSISGAVTKATLQARGWAICDGTTPTSQGITSPAITSTPNLEEKFIRMSSDESSGGTGGTETHNHARSYNTTGPYASDSSISAIADANHLPPYYELVFFIKVKFVD